MADRRAPGKIPRRLAGLLATAVVAMAAMPGAAQSPEATLSPFLARYRCEAADRLKRAHDYGDPAKEADRYLILSLARDPGSYVQCYVSDAGTKLFCEAASYYFLEERRTRYVSAGALAALGRLGFTTIEHEDNFHQEIALPSLPDYDALATLMLRALHDGYGARAADLVTFDAPHAHHDPAACRPVG